MTRWLGKYSPYFYALLRIVAGLLFAMHGSQKLLGWPPSRNPMQLDTLLKAAGVIELVGGLLIALGFFASIAALIAAGEMAVAFFKVHFSSNAPLPIQNGGELAVLFFFFFLYIAPPGSGVWGQSAFLGRPTS